MDNVASDVRSSNVNQWSPAEIAAGCVASVAAVIAVAAVVFSALAFSEVIIVPLTAVIIVGAVGIAVLLAAAVFLAVTKCCFRQEKEKLPSEQEIIQKQLDSIPSLLSDVNEKIGDKERLELIQARMVEDYPEDENVIHVPQFQSDMGRGVTFTIKDKALGKAILDPQPPHELTQEEKTEKGAEILQTFLEGEKNRNWERALQLVTNQTSLNNLFDVPKFMFLIASSKSKWEGLDGKEYMLQSAFPDHWPPIQLKIIRDKETQEIEKVIVKLKGSLDICRYNPNSLSDDSKIVQKEGIKGKLTYTVTLDENGRPNISDLHSSLTAGTTL